MGMAVHDLFCCDMLPVFKHSHALVCDCVGHGVEYLCM